MFKNKKGSSTLYELLLTIPILTFIAFFPLAVFSYLRFQNNVEDVMAISIQATGVEGGVTQETIDLINNNLKVKGLPTTDEGTQIVVSNRVGNISSSNVHIVSNGTKYRTDDSIGIIYIALYIPLDTQNLQIRTMSKLIDKISNKNTVINGQSYYKVEIVGTSELYK
jgi:hypothetical protein